MTKDELFFSRQLNLNWPRVDSQVSMTTAALIFLLIISQTDSISDLKPIENISL